MACSASVVVNKTNAGVEIHPLQDRVFHASFDFCGDSEFMGPSELGEPIKNFIAALQHSLRYCPLDGGTTLSGALVLPPENETSVEQTVFLFNLGDSSTSIYSPDKIEATAPHLPPLDRRYEPVDK